MKINKHKHPVAYAIYEDLETYDVISTLYTFVTSNEYAYYENFQYLQETIMMHYDFKPIDPAWRGTKLELGALNHILAQKPFTFKAERQIRSWSHEFRVGISFFKDINEDAISVLLKDKIPADEILLDLTMPELKEEFTVLLKKVKHDQLKLKSHQVRTIIKAMDYEAEIMRITAPKTHVMCNTIIAVGFMPFVLEEDEFEQVKTYVPEWEHSTLTQARNHMVGVVIYCDRGQLKVKRSWDYYAHI